MRDTLGHYQLLAPLGAGGMGEVYVARDPILGRKVALKMLPHRLAADRDTLTRFTQEARSASALNHPNIVTIHEVGTDDGTPYIVMEYIEGRDLRSIVTEGPLPMRKLLDLATQIADGLAAAHERGIVHRDLKPENIMLTRDGYAKVLDFGLAKVLGPGSAEVDDTLALEVPGTNPGTILGTVGYMSPEQATGRKLDYRSDQFALGAILYELATGRSAFEGDTAIDTLAAILHNEPEPITRYNVRAPAQFCEIVRRLLEKEPDDRYTSTRDLARELKALRDRVIAEQSGFDIPRPPLVPMLHSPRRTYAAIAILVVIAAAIAGAVWMLRERPGATPPPVAQSVSAQKKYVAVLRFNDLSGDARGQLVADGMADTLTARLARLSSLQIARANSAVLESNDVEKIGRDLGANLLLRGSMQRDGDRVRVTYSIYDVRTRAEVTGDTLDGNATNLFDLQDKLATSVAAALDPRAVVAKSAPLDPRVSQQRFLEALGHLRRYDKADSVDAAIGILEELGQIGSSASIQAALGRAYLAKFTLTRDQSLTRKATEFCERALASDPQNVEVRIALGNLRLSTGRTQDAIAEFNNALQQQPNSVDATIGLAKAQQAATRLKEAEQSFKRAVALQPQNWTTHNELGVFYFVTARYGDSAASFEKVIQLVPDNLFGYNNLGAAYQQMGRYDDAIGVFQRTIERKPTAQGYSNLGTCYYMLGRYRDAAVAMEESVKLAPNSYWYWGNLGDAYRWVPGSEAKAASALDKAIELAATELSHNPKDGYVRARMAESLAKRGRLREANKEIAAAIAIDRNDVRVLYCAAIVAAVQKQTAACVQWLSEAVKQGYNRSDIQLDPELREVRQSPEFQRMRL
ncbi:MAG TPA: protein kinase [Thermoanaerobaculia bacterium]